MGIASLRFGEYFDSYRDYLLVISELEIGQPGLNQIYVDVPFRNGSLDFTDLYGAFSYTDRTIKVKFQTSRIAELKIAEIYGMYDSIVAEIYGTGIQSLEIDNIEGVFTGRCVSISPVTLLQVDGQIEARLFNNSVIAVRPVIEVKDSVVIVTQNGTSQSYQPGIHEQTHITLQSNVWTNLTIQSNGGSIYFKWKRIFI